MSAGVYCRCSERSVPLERRRWVVVQRYCNHSAFNGYHETLSLWSSVRCLICWGIWRTKANYVPQLRDILPTDKYGKEKEMDETEDTTSAAEIVEPPVPVEEYPNWVLVEAGPTLHRFRNALAARASAPTGAKIWLSARHWAENSKFEDYKGHLQSVAPELCEVDDVRSHQVQWKMEKVWPALLAAARDVAVDPPGARSETGDDTMAKGAKKSKKVSAAGSGNGTGRGRKSSLDTAKKIKFGEGFKLREGSAVAARFADVRDGSTVKTALEKGVLASDILWHAKKGNISLVD